MVQVRAARLEAAAQVAAEVKHAHANVYQLLAWINGSFASERLEALSAEVVLRHASAGAALAQLARVADPSERAIVGASTAALAAYRRGVNDTIEMALVDQSLATNAMQKADKQFAALGAQLAQLSALEKSLSMAAYQRAGAEYRQLVAGMALLVLLSIALSLLVTMLVRRAMLADIHAIAGVVGALANGRLAAGSPGSGRDEIGDTARALDDTVVKLGATLRSVLWAVGSIDTASQEIASGNLDLSARTEMQASSLEQTAGAMQALTGAVAENAANARRASDLAAGAAQLATDGGQAVQRAVLTMDQVQASSRRIGEIIGVMDAISFQTNILALNAAVEAARAGAQGRGFAVVAAEVRILAQRSAAAANQIKTLIAASGESIAAGHASVNAAGASMGAIVAAVGQVNEIIECISAASAEQAAGIAEVNLAVGQMDGMTQQNAALVEQAAAAAASLHRQTVHLARAVSVFQVDAYEDGPDDLYRNEDDDGDGDRGDGDEGDAALAPFERRSARSAMRAGGSGRAPAPGKRGWRKA
jgi:methyl-accepting chemotaxis protein